MLTELKVSNFAIIDSVHLKFTHGLNIISGETGAGKSVILKSLALLMGQKAISGIIKSGEKQALIEGAFDLTERDDIKAKIHDMGIETDEDQLIVRRLLSAQGKSRVYINGHLSALSNLKDIVSPLIEVTGQAVPLIEMTGQHDSRQLQERSYHLDILDSYTSSWALRAKVTESYQELQSIQNKIDQLKTDQKIKAQRLDFLTYQRDEISSLDLKVGEEEELEKQTKRLKNSSRLLELTQQIENDLYTDSNAVLVRLHGLIQENQAIKSLDQNLADKIEPLTQAKTLIEEVVYDVRSYCKNIDEDPNNLSQSEERLAGLRKLQKKYGSSVEDILDQLSNMEDEIELLENSDEELNKLETKLDQETEKLIKSCDELHKRRLEGAQLFEKSVADELLDLNMKGLSFVVQVSKHKEFRSNGVTDIEFMTKSSKKDEAKPLNKFASGGELSRILLSVKSVLGTSEKPRTYLFDEVDAGVSGSTAEKIGQKLKSIAGGQQVICVTHLPQVACFADTHFYIHKTPSKDGVEMKVDELEKTTRIKEIARLISGEKITQTSLDHAKQLLSLN